MFLLIYVQVSSEDICHKKHYISATSAHLDTNHGFVVVIIVVVAVFIVVFFEVVVVIVVVDVVFYECIVIFCLFVCLNLMCIGDKKA